MKKGLLLFLSLVLVSGIFYCSKSDSDSETAKYYFRGTILLRTVPVEGVRVKMEYRDSSGQSGVTWIQHNQEEVTGADGKYEFIVEKVLGATTTSSWTSRISAFHPEDQFWVDWKLGSSATRGEGGASVLNINLE